MPNYIASIDLLKISAYCSTGRHTSVFRERDMVTEAWDMVTAGWYIATKPMGHGALGHGEHGTWRL